MEVLAANAIRYDSTGKQAAFRIGRIETATSTWLTVPGPVPAAEVLDMLLGGEPIQMLFETLKGPVAGPLLTVNGKGDKVIAAGEPLQGRLVGDLPRF